MLHRVVANLPHSCSRTQPFGTQWAIAAPSQLTLTGLTLQVVAAAAVWALVTVTAVGNEALEAGNSRDPLRHLMSAPPFLSVSRLSIVQRMLSSLPI